MDCTYKELDNISISKHGEDHIKIKYLEKLEGTDFIYGGVNLINGFTEVDKAYQLVKLLSESSGSVDVTYIDTDGAKDGNFVKHCASYYVCYVNRMVVPSYCKDETSTWLDASLDLIETDIKDIREGDIEPDCKLVFVLDSVSSICKGQKKSNNVVEYVEPLLYKLSHHAQEFDYCLILIDNE